LNFTTSSHLIIQASADLVRAEVDSPRLCARLIMAWVLGCSQEKLLTYPNLVLSMEEKSLFMELVARRARGEPLAYITGHKEFYGLDFMVDKSVLIPRPETELLVDSVIERYRFHPGVVFLDVGTGSGAIAVTLAHEMPESTGLACDLSLSAVKIAKGNALRHGVLDRICFFRSDLGRGIKPGSIDLVVANLPYLSREEFRQTSIEVSGYEPYAALVSEEDGLGHFRRLEVVVHAVLNKNGMVFLEMGKDQGEQVAGIFSGWKDIAVHKDLAGLDRVLTCVRQG
jgi:release factor glutamine methyltransferase